MQRYLLLKKVVYIVTTGFEGLRRQVYLELCICLGHIIFLLEVTVKALDHVLDVKRFKLSGKKTFATPYSVLM